MSGVGLVGIAAEGNENVFLNVDKHSLFQLKQSDTMIEHFAKYQSTKDISGPETIAFDTTTDMIVTIPMEDDGIGASFIELQLPEINSTRQEGLAWNNHLLSAMINRLELRSNKNIVKERTGSQMLQESKTKLNTTKYSHFSRLTGMTKENHYPYTQTYTDREFSHTYPPLSHQTIRTHSSFGHFVDRPVDTASGQLSDPTIKPELWVQHLKQTQPDSYFTQLGTTRENVSLLILQRAALLDTASSNVSSSSSLLPYTLLSNISLLQNQLVNVSATVITNLQIQSTADDLFYFNTKDDLDSLYRIWQEIETDWTNESFLTSRNSKVNFVSTISSFDVSNGNTIASLSVLKDLQTLNNSSNEGNLYLFEIQRNNDEYGFPNQTQELIGEIVSTSNTSIELRIEPDWLSFVNTTQDIGATIIHLSGEHAGSVNSISQITGANITDTEFYTFTVKDEASLANYTTNDTRQIYIGNTTVDYYLTSTSTDNITIPRANITDPSVLINSTILLRDPVGDSITVTHNSNSKSTYELLRDAFPTSWDFDAKPYVSYRELIDNITIQEGIPELSNTTINYVMQVGIVNATLQEINTVESVLHSANTEYTGELANCLTLFAGLQESFQADRYGGYYPDVRKVQNKLHGMNHLLLRLKHINEIQSNASTNLIVNHLLPKIVQQYGVISYHHHKDIFKSHTVEIYTIFNELSSFFTNAGYFPGTLDEVNVSIANTSVEFPESNVMQFGSFEIPSQRSTLMNQIDFVNGTVQFVTEAELGTAYTTDYFTLNDLSSPPSSSQVIADTDEYRFIFWWRVFQFLDKCALVKEAWLGRLYDSNMTYDENLQELKSTFNLEFLAICIQFYDLFVKVYPIVYDRYRLRAPVITQQNIPFSRNVYLKSQEEASSNITSLSSQFDITGTDITFNSQHKYLYEEYRFPQETPQAFSHLYNLDQTIRSPQSFTISLLRSIHSNVSNTNTKQIYDTLRSFTPETGPDRTLFDSFVIISNRLLNHPYFTAENQTVAAEQSTNELFMQVLPDLWLNSNVTEYIPNVTNLVVFPTKQEAGFFQSKRGSTIGFLVAKEFNTGVVYEGFQTETQNWSNVTQYDNRISNLVSSQAPYETYELSAGDIISSSFNSVDVNSNPFFSTEVANISPQVFGYRINIDNPLPITNEPKTYRSYNYRIPKYIPQAKWHGSDTSLVSMLSNPLLEYFEYLRINLVHPDDVPAALMVTNYGEVLSQQDDPWFMSHSESQMNIIQNIVTNDTTKEWTDSQKTSALREVGWREQEAARVKDPITFQSVVAFDAPTLISPINASRNPHRNEQMYDMNLRLLYRSYITVQNQLDSFNAIESPNYIPRHILDICNRIVIRCMQEYIADNLVETSPTNILVVADENDLEKEEYMVQELRAILTEFLRLLSKSNIPIENHRAVKLSFMNIWRRWYNRMVGYIRIGVMDVLLQLIISIVQTVYSRVMVPTLNLNQYDSSRRTQVWLEVMFAVLHLEGALDNEIDKYKDNDDWLLLAYSRLPEFTRDKLQTNPFELVRTDMIEFKNMCLNMLIGV